MNQKQTDEKFMRRCLQLARNGWQHAKPNPMVGAVITWQPTDEMGHFRGEPIIIGEGWHQRCGEGHAEVNAFASVEEKDVPKLPESTIYVSLEPCAHYGKTPPCADLIVSKDVKRVVVGCVDSFAKVQGRGIDKIKAAGIDVTVGVLEAECRELNRRFMTFHEKKRPYIILKWAQTQNGFLDDQGQNLPISSTFTRMLVHKLRAENDAILVGHVTENREHPQLNVRDWRGESPEKFVLSHENTIEKILATCRERNYQSLIVEGGAATHKAFLAQDLWDEIRIETAPMVVSGGTRAAELPKEAVVWHREAYDGRTIVTLRRRSDVAK